MTHREADFQETENAKIHYKSAEDPEGEGKLTVKWSSVRNVIAILALAGTLVTIIGSYFNLRNTTETNAAHILKLEAALELHLANVAIHTDKEAVRETKNDLLNRIETMQKQVDRANDKLDRLLSRGR